MDEQSRCTFTKQVHLFFARPVTQFSSITLELRKAVSEEQPYIVGDLTRLDLMEDEHIRRFHQEREPETLSNARLRATSDEEFDVGNLRHKLPKDGQDRRSGFFVLAFVQGVDHDDSRNGGFRQGLDDQLLHLTVEGLVDDFWIGLDQLDEDRSKLGVSSGELDSQGWEDGLEGPPVLEVSGAEEGCTQPPIRERPLRDRLCNSALPRPGETVQPVDRGLVEVAGPEFDFVQNCCARSFETTIPVAMSILGLLCAPKIIEDSGLGCRGVFSDDRDRNTRTHDILTWVLEGEVILCA